MKFLKNAIYSSNNDILQYSEIALIREYSITQIMDNVYKNYNFV